MSDAAVVPPFAKMFGPKECQWCGKRITQGKRGRFRAFCSSSCQKKAWADEHPAHIAQRRQADYALSTEEQRAQARHRARARQRALSQLAERYPRLYRALYEAALAEGRDDR